MTPLQLPIRRNKPHHFKALQKRHLMQRSKLAKVYLCAFESRLVACGLSAKVFCRLEPCKERSGHALKRVVWTDRMW